eukprot:2537726-Amphidinium_carterae.1
MEATKSVLISCFVKRPQGKSVRLSEGGCTTNIPRLLCLWVASFLLMLAGAVKLEGVLLSTGERHAKCAPCGVEKSLGQARVGGRVVRHKSLVGHR